MSNLPNLPYPKKNANTYQVDFKGLNHTLGASDGDIYDMENMTSDHYPVLSPRERRRLLHAVKHGRGVFSYGGHLYWIDGKYVRKDGETVGRVEDSETVRTFAALQNKILIFPDKKYIDIDNGSFGSLEAEVSGDVVFKAEGEIYGSKAERNTIYSSTIRWSDYFKAGDAVEISLSKRNNKTAIIREIDGVYLRFSENTFELPYSLVYNVQQDMEMGTYCYNDRGSYYHFRAEPKKNQSIVITQNRIYIDDVPQGSPIRGEKGTYLEFAEKYEDEKDTITVSRKLPDFDVSCVVSNRLWGAKGSEIYGSALGNPFNFNVFDGLSTDSYYLKTETDEEFTACIGYNGYPLFFKEHSIYKLYGDYPSNFQLAKQMQQGVKKGCSRSLVIAGEILYYVAKNGVMAYSGGIPSMISEPLGKRIQTGVAVSDGQKYYLSAHCDDGSISLYVFDSYKKMWHREDDIDLVSACLGDYAIGMTETNIWSLSPGCEDGKDEGRVSWMVEFADMVFGSPFKKGIAKLNLRLDPSGGGRAKIEIMYDSNRRWDVVKTIDRNRKHSDILPIVPHRCDHFKIRVRGQGVVDIYGMAVQYYHGSEHRGGVYNNG